MKIPIFKEIFLSPVSRIVPKCKRGPLGVFEHPFFCKIGKMKEALWRPQKFAKKVSQSRKKPAQKFLVKNRCFTI